MSEERPMKREITTAELAAAAERAKTRGDRDPAQEQEQEQEQAQSREARAAREREVAVAGREAPADMAPDTTGTPLLPADVADRLRRRWTDVQAGFVDEPRRAVEEADALVADAIKQLAQSFSGARANLERDWSRGEDVSTEDLRRTLQRYRAFFGRLLQI